jgi:CTP synthase
VSLSVVEALRHAGINNDVKVNIDWINSENLDEDNYHQRLKSTLEGKKINGILVPGGFGDRGIEGKILAIKYARENQIPFLGICLGMQMAVVEFARNVCSCKDANSTEFNSETANPVIHIMEDQKSIKKKGGTMRLGSYPCKLVFGIGSHSFTAYFPEGTEKTIINERHRHRYEFNNKYREVFEKCGLKVTGHSPDDKLVEIVELENHPFFVGCQFHPELKSRPNRPHPLFKEFVFYSKEIGLKIPR